MAMEVLIVGAGAIGRWFGGMLESPVFTDIDHEQAVAAASAVGGTARDIKEIESIEVVCVAVPMPTASEVIARFASYATTAIIDLTGSMTGPLAAMRNHASTIERASFHPLFAPSNAPGRIAMTPDNEGPVITEIESVFESHGNHVFRTTAEEHDRAMETVQAKTHTALLAFALAADAVPADFQTPIYRGLQELTHEMTDGNPRVYADIQETFSGAQAVADAARQIADADRETYEQLYRDANE